MDLNYKHIVNRIFVAIERNFIHIYFIVAIIVGLFYLFIHQAKDLPDAFPNYVTSYALADRMTGRNVDIIDNEYRGIKGQKIGEVPIRKCDEVWFVAEEDYSSVYDDDYVKNNSDFFVGRHEEYVTKKLMLHTYSAFPTYIFDAIAIIIGRFLGFGPYLLYEFVRVVNLMIYIIFGLLAFKALPLMRHFIFILYLNPKGLEYAVSTSHESLWWPFAWFYIIFISSYIIKDEIKTKDYMWIVILSCLIAPIKGQGIGFVLLILLMRKKSFSSIKAAYRFIIACLLISATVWLVYNLSSVPAENIFMAADGGRFVTKTQSDAVYVADIISNPLHYSKILLYTFATRFIYFANCFYPQYMYYTDIALYGFMGLFLFSLVDTDEGKEFVIDFKKRVSILFIYLVLYALMCILTLISWAGKVAIEAVVKIMYVMPFLPLLGLMLKNGQIMYRGKYKTQIIVMGTMLWHFVGLASTIVHFKVFGTLI